MAQLPIDPPPSSVDVIVDQPSAKSWAINGVDNQSRSSGIFLWRVKLAYALLEFEERDILQAFLIDQSGRVGAFDVIIPTYSENRSVVNTTGTATASYNINTSIISVSGMTGEFKVMNLLRANGKKATYVVMEVWPPAAGVQQIRIKPPLRDALTLGDTILTKNVPMSVTLDKDSVSVKNRGMSATIAFDLIEEPK